MSARTLTDISPAEIAEMLHDDGVRLLDIGSNEALGGWIVDAFGRRGHRLGRASNDYDSVRAELTALIHGRIADGFDPAHLAAVEEQSRALRERLGRRS